MYNYNMKKIDTKKLAVIGMLCAVAYVVMILIHVKLIPAANFLTYDPKDAIIVIGGFIFGPVYAIIISIIVSFLEFVTVSSSGLLGFISQVIATAAFTLPATIIYQKHRTKKAASIGLGIGVVALTVVMLLWNYLLTPLYMGVPRSDVAAMLIPIFLPFNLLKGVLNGLIALLIYKPIVNALRKVHMVESRKALTEEKGPAIEEKKPAIEENEK